LKVVFLVIKTPKYYKNYVDKLYKYGTLVIHLKGQARLLLNVQTEQPRRMQVNT